MFKLIVSDIDGTLVPTGGRLPSPALVEILTQCLDTGAVVALASGRPLSGLVDLFPPLRDRLIYICCNGSHIVQGDQTMSVSRLASDRELERLIRLLRDLRCDYMLDTTEVTLMENSVSETVLHMIADSGISVEMVPDITKTSLPALKITIFYPGDPMALMNHPQIMGLSGQYTLVVTAEHYLDITRKDIDKGTAVLELQREFRISPEETIVFGNAMNDVPMFMATPNSYAVEGAPEIVRSHAAHIVKGPEYNGVTNCLISMIARR